MYWSLSSASPAIDVVWAGDSVVDPGIGHRSDPVLGADVVFTLAGGDCSIAIQGPVTRRRTYPHRPGVDYIGGRFAPGASEATIGGDLRQLCDDSTPFPAGDLAPPWPDLDRLVERLLAADTLAERGRLVQVELASAPGGFAAPPPLVTEALRRFAAGNGPVRVASVADGLGVGERHLQRCFRQHLGLSPKLAARLIRVDRLLGLLADHPPGGSGAGLADVAQRAGFFDHAHMTNDVRRVLGTTPTAILAELDQRKPARPSR